MNIDKLKAIIQKANPEIMEYKGPENWWVTEMEVAHIVKDTIGEAYQKRYNKSLDYDQWAGIQEHMETCAHLMNEKIVQSLSLNREAIGRPIRLADVLLAIEKRPGNDMFFVAGHWPNGIKVDDSVTFAYGAVPGILKLWNLSDDNLDNQSDECKEFLTDLLCKK